MKTQNTLIALFAAFALVIAMPLQAGGPLQNSPANCVQQSVLTTLTLNDDEVKTLNWMREEEKMARDVYQVLYKTWQRRIFKNIATSEQMHMDAVLGKLTLLNLPDPATNQAGTFNNLQLQALYDQLVAQGQQSYLDALRVGATIEEVDIQDLQAAIAQTSNLAMKTMYQNLQDASENHLRSFVTTLNRNGVTYQPQYLDAAWFAAIMSY